MATPRPARHARTIARASSTISSTTKEGNAQREDYHENGEENFAEGGKSRRTHGVTEIPVAAYRPCRAGENSQRWYRVTRWIDPLHMLM